MTISRTILARGRKVFDVAVIGGGPAGIATAVMLARAGRQVAVIERTCYDRIRIGETLPPRARPLLAELGLSTRLQHDGHICAPGIVTAWGEAQPRCNDFIVNPYGNGWHLDRPRFDRMLVAHARSLGVTICEHTAITACEADGNGWRVGLRNADGISAMTCPFVVDASGRRASPIKRRAGRHVVHDRLIGIAAFTRSTHTDRRMLIEATAGGWWYSALLPGDRHVAVYMTDADTIDVKRSEFSGFIRQQLRAASHTRARCGDLDPDTNAMPFAAMTYCYQQVRGRNWVLAGDAAMAWDPLSGQGICKALESGMHAAHAIDRALDGDDRALSDYAQWTQAQFTNYLEQRAHYYRAEQRWPDAPFWRRRHLAS